MVLETVEWSEVVHEVLQDLVSSMFSVRPYLMEIC